MIFQSLKYRFLRPTSFINKFCQMGPNEEPHNFSSNSPIRVDSIESDDEEIARLRAEGWQIGFGVQMHVAVAAEDDGRVNAGDQNESADSESDATNDAQFSDADNGENPPTPNCGYVLLPSAVEEEPSSPSATAPTTAFNWLPTNSTPISCILPPPPTAAELGRIQHKPIDIKLDNVKVEEIKRIMSQMALLGPQPEWVQTIDDEQLSELVGQLKKAEVTGGK